MIKNVGDVAGVVASGVVLGTGVGIGLVAAISVISVLHDVEEPKKGKKKN